MKAHEEAVFKVRSGLMHYAQGYTTKTDGFISMSLTVHSMGVTFYQWPELSGPNLVNLNLLKSRTTGWLESDMGYKNVHF